MSSDDSVRPHQHIRRNRQADLLGCFQIDDEIELSRSFNGKIAGLGAFDNLVDKNGRAAIEIEKVHRVANDAAGFGKIARPIDGKRCLDTSQPLCRSWRSKNRLLAAQPRRPAVLTSLNRRF